MDQDITTLQTDVDTELTILINLNTQMENLQKLSDASSTAALAKAKMDAGYQANIPAYSKIQVDMDNLNARIDLIKNIETSTLKTGMKTLHDIIFGDTGIVVTHQKQDKLGTVTITSTKRSFDGDILGLINFEIALKTNSMSASK
jgi:hypothetical protein